MLHRIIYLSQAAAPFTDAHLLDLLDKARAHNQAHHLTGLLFYGDGQFLQVLEGPEAAVRAVYTRILRDPRHHQVQLYAEQTTGQRAFATWSMGYEVSPPARFLEFAGYAQPADLAAERPGLSETDQLLMQLLRVLVPVVSGREPVA